MKTNIIVILTCLVLSSLAMGQSIGGLQGKDPLPTSLVESPPGLDKEEDEDKPATCEQAYATRYYTSIRKVLTMPKGCRHTFKLNNAQKSALAGFETCKKKSGFEQKSGFELPTYKEMVHAMMMKAKKKVGKDKCSQLAFEEEKKAVGKLALELLGKQIAHEACKHVKANQDKIKQNVAKSFDKCATKELEAKNKERCELGEEEFCSNPKAVLDKTQKAEATPENKSKDGDKKAPTTSKTEDSADGAKDEKESDKDKEKDEDAEGLSGSGAKAG